jgi:hypothetical protein
LCMTTAAISVLPSPVGRHTSAFVSSAVCNKDAATLCRNPQQHR